MTHTVSFAQWISQYWPTAYRFSSIHDISMGHYPDPSAQTQNICPAESGEANWPPQWETVFTTAERLFGLKELKICWLWSYREDVFSLSKDNARALTRTQIHLLAAHRKLIKCDEMSEEMPSVFENIATLNTARSCKETKTIKYKEKNHF